jgi:predicted dinucleotide-binding enzyme
MKVGVIGSGVVGQALANGFVKHGYEVMIGTNDTSKYEDLKNKTNGMAKVGPFAEVAKFGEILVLAVKGSAAEAAVKSLGSAGLGNKTVLDATNPIADAPPTNGVLKFFTTLNESLLERLQKLVPTAHFVKAFSCIGSAFMVNPDFAGVKPTMFICGNDANAKHHARRIVEQFGFEIEDLGRAEAARAIEPLCILYCIPGLLSDRWTHAFKLLKK